MSSSTPKRITETAEWERADRLAAAGVLAAGVVHEARNLMTAIVSFAQIGQLTDRPGDHAARFARIELETRRCVDMLSGFLDLVRSGGDSLNEEATDVNEVIASASSLMQSTLRLRRVSLDIQLTEELPMVRSNPDGLRQVLVNLLTNAAHATPELGRIVVASFCLDGGVAIAVRDSGPGIPEALREEVFEPLFTTKPVGEGTGLGLAVCRNLVEGWGGTVFVDGETSSGTSMVVHLMRLETSGRR